MSKVSIIRPGAKRPVSMDAKTAHALVKAGKFRYADPTQTPLSRPKPSVGTAVTPSRSRAARKVQATAETQGEALEGKTKEAIVAWLQSYGQKADRRLNKATLLKQAQRYQRRDMRAE